MLNSGWAKKENIVLKINSNNILNIFRVYGLKIDKYSKKIICPFPSHSNGMEKTPSFFYYPETNSFYCYGCGKGGGVLDFICSIENISKQNAIDKALEYLSIDDCDCNYKTNDYEEIEELNIYFSNLIREKIHSNSKELSEIENVCKDFDRLKPKMKNAEGLKKLICLLEERRLNK